MNRPVGRVHSIRYDQMVELLERVPPLYKRWADVRIPRDKEVIQQQITVTAHIPQVDSYIPQFAFAFFAKALLAGITKENPQRFSLWRS